MPEPLFIYLDQEPKLDYKYHFNHNVLVRLYDQIVWYLKDESFIKRLNYNIKVQPGENIPDNEDELYEWLVKNGYQDELDIYTSRHLFLGLLSEICHFLYQSLASCKDMKITVALSLLRKPFLECLIILEQLLVNEKEFLQKFEKDPTEFDPGAIKKDKKLDLIKRVYSEIDQIQFMDYQTNYDWRYNPSYSEGIYAVSNLATHLVTTRHQSFKTVKQNLNLVFSNEDDFEVQLSYYYNLVPGFMIYLLDVIDSYTLKKKLIKRYEYKSRRFYRLIATLTVTDSLSEKPLKGKGILNSLARKIKVKCQNCNKNNQFYRSDFHYLIHDEELMCKHCLRDLIYESDTMKPVINGLVNLPKHKKI